MNATPARVKAAKIALADGENYIRELTATLRESGLLEHHPELAALVDEARGQAEHLRRARVNL